MAAGLRPVLSRRYLVVLLIVIAANILYALAVAWNPLLLYLSLVFLILYGVSRLLIDAAEGGKNRKGSKNRKALLALVAILLVSFALRAIGASWGFPIFGHPDEPAVTDPAVAMIGRRTIDPGFYSRPNHISIYASEILYPLIDKALPHAGNTPGFAADMKPFYLTSRLVTACWGVLLTAAAYFVGSMTAPAVGLIAAALFALLPPFVENSHYITPDVPVTALLTFVLLFCIRYLRDGRIRDLFLALVFSCVGIAEKYPAFLTLPLLLAVVVFRSRGESAAMPAPAGNAPLRDRKTALVIFLIAGAFIVVGAYVYRHPHLSSSLREYISSALHRPVPANFVPRVRTIARLIAAGGLLLGALAVFLRFLRGEKYRLALFVLIGMPLILFLITPYLFINFSGALSAISRESKSTHLGADSLGYFGNLIFYAKSYVDAAGIVSLLFMGIGIAYVFRERSLLPLLFSFFYWACLSALGLHWTRWALPMYVGPLLLASHGLYQAYLFLTEKIGRGGAYAVLGVLCAVPAMSLALTSVNTTYQLAREDTRAVSLRWCNDHGLTEQNTVFDGYTPFESSGARTVDYPGSADKAYVVVSSEMYGRYQAEKTRYKAQADMYTRIFALPLLASFTPVTPRASSSFELGNIPAQLDMLKRLGGSNGPAYGGPTILIYRKAP